MGRRPFIIDCDTGTDDAIAQHCLLFHGIGTKKHFPDENGESLDAACDHDCKNAALKEFPGDCDFP